METNKITLYSSCLLLYIAKADEKLEKKEISIIKEILIDYFKIDNSNAVNIIKLSFESLREATDVFEYANFLNENLGYTDKLDLVKCIFEVGYADGKLHYLEMHYIKTIANILNIEKEDIIKANLEIKKYF
tara:strand:- start:1334 stop:1726 length:393 start_codon:yes stop_codon:yes gene_type:complete